MLNDLRHDGFLMDAMTARIIVGHFEMYRDAKDAIDLTLRELKILQLIANGKLSKEIAAALSISEHTVHDHIKHIYAKMHVHSRGEAVRVGKEEGLIP